MDKHGVQHWRAVATSAMREARNRDEIIARIFQTSGIHPGDWREEEARVCVSGGGKAGRLKNKLAPLADIGGGSVEITAINAKIAVTESWMWPCDFEGA